MFVWSMSDINIINLKYTKQHRLQNDGCNAQIRHWQQQRPKLELEYAQLFQDEQAHRLQKEQQGRQRSEEVIQPSDRRWLCAQRANQVNSEPHGCCRHQWCASALGYKWTQHQTDDASRGAQHLHQWQCRRQVDHWCRRLELWLYWWKVQRKQIKWKT